MGALLIVTAGLRLTSSTTGRTDVPSPIAIIEDWAAQTPIDGLRCTGVAVERQRLWTARHCLIGGAARALAGASLCDADPHEVPRHLVAGAPEPDQVSGGDFVSVLLDQPLALASLPSIGHARTGRALVYGFGDHPDLGRATCEAASYEGRLEDCPRGVATGWCIETGPGTQLCGGSSGSPVYVLVDGRWELVGVISRGPPCGEPGWAVVAIPQEPG